MQALNVDLWTCDIGTSAETAEAYVELLVSRTEQSWDAGADVVVFPEFSWMGLERFVSGENKLHEIAHLFWEKLWPDIFVRLNREGKAVVLGTVPYLADGGELHNRAPICSNGEFIYQDKIHLTPWESDFSGGRKLRIWDFKGYRLAVVICLDIEIPEISVALRGSEVDLLLVPSATENLMGVERIGRCASARAVELGCGVGLCHLVGNTESDLVDENIGKLAFFTPSQSCFELIEREESSELLETGYHLKSARLDGRKLKAMRASYMETNPALVTAHAFDLKSS